MFRIFTMIGLLLLSLGAFCQGGKHDTGQNKSLKTNEKVKTGHFPGGDDSLKCYLAKNLDPKVISGINLPEGSVNVVFVIDTTGKISNITILKSYSREVDEEIVRVINKMPGWIPSEQLVGYPKGTWVKVPFEFELSIPVPYLNPCPGK